MLNRDRDAKPDGTRSLLLIGQESMLNHERSRFQARVFFDNPLVYIKQCTYRSITDGVRANPPTSTNCEVGYCVQIIRFPEQMSTVARVVQVWLVEGTAFG